VNWKNSPAERIQQWRKKAVEKVIGDRKS